MLPDVMGFGRQTSRIIFCILQDLFEYKIKRNQKILSSNFFFPRSYLLDSSLVPISHFLFKRKKDKDSGLDLDVQYLL